MGYFDYKKNRSKKPRASVPLSLDDVTTKLFSLARFVTSEYVHTEEEKIDYVRYCIPQDQRNRTVSINSNHAWGKT